MELLNVAIKQAGYENQDQDKSTVNNINFSLNKGEIKGLIGPNGAGKSTTIKAILDLLPKMKGEIHLTGEKKNYAYIPEQSIFYDKLTLWEHMEFAAAVYEIERDTSIKVCNKA